MHKPRKSLVIDYRKGWSTHMPVLINLFNIADGPVMEVGSGVYSTPLLHWLCHPTKRKLVSYETNIEFIGLAKEYQSKYHKIVPIDDYGNIPISDRYSIIFIDNDGSNRVETAIRLGGIADYIVIHDTNASSIKEDFRSLKKSFKYYRDYEFARPWTGVASNVKPLDLLW